MEDNKIHENPPNPSNPRFRRYLEYKESGVEWIGGVPAHWEVKRLKYVAEILPSNVDKHIYPDEIQVKLCNYTDVYYNNYITVDTILEKGSCNEREFTKFVLRKGNVIITKDSETSDDIGVPTFVKDDLDTVVCGYHLTMIRPLACHGEFIFRFIQSDRTRRYFEVNSNGITRYGLGKSSIENLFLPIPPDSEQRQIAKFLDCKTEQIDELIRIKEQRIALLQEQRTALINQTVTKGLDPNVEMKPSGVEWIGKIPARWKVRRNKRIFNERDDRSATGEEELLTVSYITGVSPRAEKKNVGMFLAETLEGYKPCSVGNLVINTMWAWMGALGVSTFDGIVSPSYNVYELKSSEYLPRYYDYLYHTPNHVKEIIRWSKGIWNSRWRLYPDAFFSMSAIVPPFGEQKQIVDFLEHKNNQIDELIAAEQRKIELLKEYRQSLISEAVTGKIDVRSCGGER